MRVESLPTTLANGVVVWDGVIADITDRKRLETELTASHELLEQRVTQRTVELQRSNDEMAAFSYSVSHDLRAPLRAIGGFSRLLEEEVGNNLSPEARGHLDRVHRAVRRMDSLIEALLVLAHLNKQEMLPQQINLSALVNQLVNELADADPQRKVEFKIAPGVSVQAAPDLLRVALQNLLGNAWKFTGKVSRALIEFDLHQAENTAPVYFVRDNGTGFNMAYADKLFLPFQRLHAEQDYPGMGIGLATVRRVIERHGGRVWAVAEPGHGATFYFTLPEKIPLIAWNDTYNTGHEQIDKEHRNLVGIFNELAESMSKGQSREECATVLNALVEYAQSHFLTEEQLMAAHSYSHAAQHKAIHDRFFADVQAFKAQYESGAVTLPVSLLTFLQEWLNNHIKAVDKTMVKDIKAIAPIGSDSPLNYGQ
jgi:hemerythrin-like metal-binding protein